MERLPVFVYGTLRHGQGNYSHLLKGRTECEFPAQARDVVLFGQGIPYAVERAGGVVVGDLMVIPDGVYDEVLRDLDTLEGYDAARPHRSHYVRAVRKVRYLAEPGQWREVAAYLYLAGSHSQSWFADNDLIPYGDWVASRAA